MKEKTDEWREANFNISAYLGMTWVETCKLNQADRDFLLKKAVEVKTNVEEQQKVQARYAAEQEKMMQQAATGAGNPVTAPPQQPTMTPAAPAGGEVQREVQPWA